MTESLRHNIMTLENTAKEKKIVNAKNKKGYELAIEEDN